MASASDGILGATAAGGSLFPYTLPACPTADTGARRMVTRRSLFGHARTATLVGAKLVVDGKDVDQINTGRGSLSHGSRF